MAQVPGYTSQLDPIPMPAPMQSGAGYDSSAFGAGIGQGLTQLGNAGEEAAVTVQRHMDNLAVTNTKSGLMKTMTDAQSTVFNARGEAAPAAFKDYQQSMADARDAAYKDLTPRQSALLDQHFGPLMIRNNALVTRHVNEQLFVAQDTAAQANISAAVDGGVYAAQATAANPGQAANDAYQAHLDDIKNAVNEYISHRDGPLQDAEGKPTSAAVTAQQLIQKNIEQMHAKAVMGLQTSNPQAAVAYLTAHKEEMDPGHYESLMNRNKTEVEINQAQQTWSSKYDALNPEDPAAQLTHLMSDVSSGKVDATLAPRIKQLISDKQQAMDALSNEDTKKSLAALTTLRMGFINNKNSNPESMSQAQLAANGVTAPSVVAMLIAPLAKQKEMMDNRQAVDQQTAPAYRNLTSQIANFGSNMTLAEQQTAAVNMQLSILNVSRADEKLGAMLQRQWDEKYQNTGKLPPELHTLLYEAKNKKGQIGGLQAQTFADVHDASHSPWFSKNVLTDSEELATTEDVMRELKGHINATPGITASQVVDFYENGLMKKINTEAALRQYHAKMVAGITAPLAPTDIYAGAPPAAAPGVAQMYLSNGTTVQMSPVDAAKKRIQDIINARKNGGQ